jgi:death on curing protein
VTDIDVAPEPKWLDVDDVIALHAQQLAIYGGGDGIRDLGMLESAVNRPVNQHAYGETDLLRLAAAYAFGISSNHPFIDGNKRAAFVSMMLFLRENGVVFRPDSAEATAAILALAAGEISEDGLTRWIRDNLPKA